jgi:hypothetical protein
MKQIVLSDTVSNVDDFGELKKRDIIPVDDET